MQGLELSSPPLCAPEDLLPAHDLPSSPPTPPAPFHQFPNSEDHTRIRAVAATTTPTGSTVLCTVIPQKVDATLPTVSVQQGSRELVIILPNDCKYLSTFYRACRNLKWRQRHLV